MNTKITTAGQMIHGLLTSPSGLGILADAARLCNEHAAGPETDPNEKVTLTRMEINSLILLAILGGRVVYESIHGHTMVN